MGTVADTWCSEEGSGLGNEVRSESSILVAAEVRWTGPVVHDVRLLLLHPVPSCFSDLELESTTMRNCRVFYVQGVD